MNSVMCPGINGVLTKLANGKREKSEIERSPKSTPNTPPMSFLCFVLLFSAVQWVCVGGMGRP